MKREDKVLPGTPSDFFDMSGLNGADMAGRLSSALMDLMGKSGAEFVAFVNTRLQEDAKAQQALMSCQSTQELSALQAEYVRNALEQYTEETGRMIRLSHAAMQEIVGAALRKPG